MGFSLGNFLKGVEAQVNPFDGGQTYGSVTKANPVSTPGPARTAPAPASTSKVGSSVGKAANLALPFLIHPSRLYNPMVVQPVSNMLKLDRGVYYDAPRLAAAALTHNQAAANNAKQQLYNDSVGAGHMAQGFARTLPELGLSIADMKDAGQTYHPNSALERMAFGSTPVQDIQAKVHDTQAKHGNAAALAEGAWSLTQDLPIGVAALKGAGKAAKAVHETGQAGYIAGPKAARFDKMAQDNKTQGNSFERSDSKMTVKKGAPAALDSGSSLKLGQVVNHKELAKDYSGKNGSPDLMNGVRVVVNRELAVPAFDKTEKVIQVPSGKYLTSEAGRTRLAHEVQHSIDHAEGRSAGTSPQFEATRAMNPEQQAAAKIVQELKPQVAAINDLVKRGNLTKEEAATHPAVVAYQNATKALAGAPKYSDQASLESYLANPGEVKGRLVAERAGLSQKQIDANPLRLPTEGAPKAPEGQFSFAQDKPINPHQQEVIDTLAKERADMLREADKTGGVHFVPGEGAKLRQSSNSPFYRQYYKANGKPPTKAAYLEEAHRQLSVGSDQEAALYQDALRYKAPKAPKSSPTPTTPVTVYHGTTPENAAAIDGVELDTGSHKNITVFDPSKVTVNKPTTQYPELEAAYKLAREKGVKNPEKLPGKALGNIVDPYFDKADRPNQTRGWKISKLQEDSQRGATPPPVEPPLKSSSKMESGEKMRGFTQSVKASDEVSPEAKDMTMTSYAPKKNEELVANSEKLVAGSIKKASNQVHDALDTTKAGKLSDQQVSDAIAVAKKLDETGDFRQAADIFDKLAEHLTEAGRQVQAASLLNHLSPQGLLYSAQKTLKKAYEGGDIPEEVMTKLKSHIDDIKGTKPNTDARTLAVQRMVQFVNDKIPRGKIDATFGIWRAGLLTGPETVAKIAMSHVTLLPELAVKPVTATVDRAISHAPGMKWLNRHNPDYTPGERSATFNLGQDAKAFGSGFGSGVKAAGRHLVTGEDAPNTGGFEAALGKAKHQTKYEQTVYRVHGSVYKPFYSGAFKLERANQRRIAEALYGKNTEAVAKFMDDPTQLEKANEQAAKFAMQNITEGGKAAQQIQHIKIGPIPVGMWLAPFSRIPAALGIKGIVDYTPIGTLRAGKSLYDGIRYGKFDQRKFVESLSKSGVGGTAVVWAGNKLMSSGRMTLQEPNDPKEKGLWDLQGKSRNSVYLGGTVTKNDKGVFDYNGGHWVTLNTMGPLGLALGIGGAWNQAIQSKQDINQATAVAISSGVKLLADQPYMKGITGPANAITHPAQFASGYLQSSLTSFVPAGIQQTARGIDSKQRMAPDGLGQAIEQTIPGLRGTTPAKTDLYGKELPGANPSGSVGGGVLGTINPFYPNKARNAGDMATQELQRLYNLQGGQGPNISNPKTIQGTPTSQLSNNQIHDFMTSSGPGIKKAVDNLVQNSSYQALTDDQKTQAINSAISKVRSITFLSPKTGYLPSGPVSGSAADLISGIGTYAKAFMTDPASALNDMLHGQHIIRTVGGGLIVARAGQKDTGALINARGGSTQGGVPMQLDHVVPLELGGTNAVSNLSLVPKSVDDANNAAENFLGKQLNSGAINMKTAQKLITDYKQGEISGADLYAKAGGKGNGNVPDSVVQTGVFGTPVTGKKTTKSQIQTAQNLDSLGTGKISVSKAGKASLTAQGTDPKSKYQTDLATYQNSKKNGSLTDMQDMQAQTKLAKEKVQSGYSQDVLSFYGMSKPQQEAYFGVNRNKANELYSQAKQLDQALLDQGIITTSKYKKDISTSGVKTAKVTKSSKKKASGGVNVNFAKLVVSPKSASSSTSALRSILGHTKIKARKVQK